MSVTTTRVAARRRLRSTWQHNHLLRSSLLLTIASAVTALTGFVFWAVVARTYSTAEVGMASSLITAVSLISYLSLFGLNSVLVRFFVQSTQRNALVTRSLVGVVASSVVIAGTAYVVVLQRSGDLRPITHHSWFAVVFVLSSVISAVNLLSDSLFISTRQAQYNVLADGVVQGLVKLTLPLAFVALGAVGIFLSTTVAALAAAAVSLFAAWRVLGVRLDLVAARTDLIANLRFGVSTYVSSVFYLMPILLVPLVVLGRSGAATAGVYYIAYQISNLLNAVSTAIGESLFAEGSHAGADFRRLLRRSAVLLGITVGPGALALALLADPVMAVFGSAYAGEGAALLRLLALNAVVVSVITWGSFALKVAGRLRHLMMINGVYCTATLVLVAALAPQGLVGVGRAWVIAGAIVGPAVVIAVLRSARSHAEEADHGSSRRNA